ncbi:hypothetical protein NC653_010566 [Populus alba x Populus x berolinensis]|uniref:Uncharacterized protein n=1 Tax=Populus alba x Populus x berolinensis TaxID=444605 RepID=A0AAD6R0A3_9ROSI|nr:hypothetical protein NC653_010566 [Populus alba x Populus x berolinensis]
MFISSHETQQPSPISQAYCMENHPRKQLQGIRGQEQMPCHAQLVWSSSCAGNGKENRSKEEEFLELAKEKVVQRGNRYVLDKAATGESNYAISF